MNFKDKTNKEIFDIFKEISTNGGKVTLEMMDIAVASRSIEDKIAPFDAPTIFYSGESDKFIDKFVKKNPQIRALIHTEAYQFIGDKQFTNFLKQAIKNEYPDYDENRIEEEMNTLLREPTDHSISPCKEGKGYWTVLSRNFALDTKGESYAFISRSSFEKIYGADELWGQMKSPYDNITICKINKESLKGLELREVFDAVKNSVIDDLSNSLEYYDEHGIKIGQDFTGTSVEGKFNNVTPKENEYLFAAKHGEYLPFCDVGAINSKYPDLNKITDFMESYRFTTSLIAHEYLTSKNASPETIAKLDLPDKGLKEKYGYDIVGVKIYQLKDEMLLKSGGADYSTISGMGKSINSSSYYAVSNIGVTSKNLTDMEIADLVVSNSEKIKSQLGNEVGIGTVLEIREKAYFIDEFEIKEIPEFSTEKKSDHSLSSEYIENSKATIHHLALRLDEKVPPKTEQVMTLLDTRVTGLEKGNNEEFFRTARIQAEKVQGIIVKEPAVIIVDTKVEPLQQYIGKPMLLSEANKIISNTKSAYDSVLDEGKKGYRPVDIDVFSKNSNGIITKVGIRMELNEEHSDVSGKMYSVLKTASEKTRNPIQRNSLNEISKNFTPNLQRSLKQLSL